MNRRTARLLRALVAVLPVDVSATSALVVAARRARARRSDAALAGVAVVAAASLLPGMAAVIREVHAHGSSDRAPHSARATTLPYAAIVSALHADADARHRLHGRAEFLTRATDDRNGLPVETAKARTSVEIRA